MMPIVGIIFFQRDYKLSNSTILLIGVVLSVHFLQMVNFGGAIINLIKPTCLLLVCAIFAKIICCKFVKVYLDLVCFISQVCCFRYNNLSDRRFFCRFFKLKYEINNINEPAGRP